MNKQITCVLCPNSCHLEIEYNEKTKTITELSGNECNRAQAFVQQELTQPMRTLTFSVLVENGDLPLVSTRSENEIPLTMIPQIAKQLKKVILTAPVNCGDVVYQNDACKIIATKNISGK